MLLWSVVNEKRGAPKGGCIETYDSLKCNYVTSIPLTERQPIRVSASSIGTTFCRSGRALVVPRETWCNLRMQLLTAALLLAVSTGNPTPRQGAQLTQASLAEWRAAILPTAEELAFRKIGWRSELRNGLIEGERTNKPVLLWAMNGHPLGCV